MQVSAPAAFIETPEPRSFSGLMELYEANYIRFRRLCPGLDGVTGHAVSVIEDALDLHLRILERTTYTDTVILTSYLQGERCGFSPDPNLRIRVYHDARQAEVLDAGFAPGLIDPIRGHSIDADSQLAASWRWNRFLYKWLGYCLHHGHRFPRQAAPCNTSCRCFAEPV